MSGSGSRSEGPDLEAYSRVTNPERFLRLHDVAAELLERLEHQFDVARLEGYGLDAELEQRSKLKRPSVALVPRDTTAAPVVIVFSAFPGIHARFGRWLTPAFPSCGCDACNETFESEAERLRSRIEDLTAGRFHESIRIPETGPAFTESEFWSARGRNTERSQVDRERARELLVTKDHCSYDWRAWPKHPS